jgi:phosphatidylserine decarboxylase
MSAGIVAVILGWPVIGWFLVAMGSLSLIFFRDPARQCTAPPEVACSPADGRVVEVGDSCPALTERGLPRQVGVFMSILDVHVNRAPIDGVLVDYTYTPGRRLPAFTAKAAECNEQNLSVWEGGSGRLALRQVAGVIARRIVFDHPVGGRVRRAGRIGLIRYGSRVDLFLPAQAEILVEVGDRVRAGETAVARMKARGLP